MALLRGGTRIYGTGTVDTTLYINGSTGVFSTNSGDLQVIGGVGVGGGLYVGGILTATNIYLGNQQVFSTVITAGTDTAVSTSTGNITIWNTSTLQTITNRGSSTTNAISITNTTTSASTTTGALIVTGGVGIGGNLNVGGIFTVTNKTQATTTNSGALQVVGGVGIGGNLYVGGIFSATAVYINGVSVGLGYTGSTGTQGNVGFTGSQGYWGSVGYTGSASTATGYTGSKGQTGNDGTSVTIIGSTSTATVSAFSALDPTPTKGDGIIVTFNGHLWTYTSATGGASVFGFVDVGIIVGYTGSIGPAGAGYTGSTGTQGQIGFTGSTGTQGVSGYTGSTGTQGIAGFTGSASTVTGYTGSQGYTGSKGGFEATQIITTQTGTTYTLALTDAGYLINFTNAAGTTVTIPPESVVNFNIGQRVDLEQYNTGPVVVSPGAGVTLHSTDSPILTNQYSIGTLIKIGTNEWTFAGPATSAAGYAGSQGTTGFTGSQGYTGSKGGFEATQIITTQTGTTYTLALTDAGYLINFSNAAGTTVTIPPESTVNFNIGQRIDLEQYNTGPVVVSAGAGVTLHSTDSPILTNQYSIGTLIKIGTNEWTFAGPATNAAGYAGSQGITGFTGSQGYTGSKGGFEAVQVINTQTGTTYTLALTDAGELINFTNSVGTTVSIPAENTINFSIGQRIDLTQGNTGPVIVTAVSGVTLHSTDSPILTNQYSIGTLIKIGSNEWTFAGPATMTVGYTGSQGYWGSVGYTGSQGSTGTVGFTGSTGTQGVTGFTGSTGTQGLVGFTGSTGTQGVTGFTGSTGTQGIAGYAGSVGYTGSASTASGYTGSYSTATTTPFSVLNTLTSISPTTGALVVSGGAGIGGSVYIGNNLYVSNGSQVIPTTIQEFTATNGQTIFTPSSGYSVGTVQVFANGVALGNGDFTASNGTTIVLYQARTTGDIIRVIAGVSSTGVNNIKAFSIAMSVAMGG
jgi:hypothetical protein